MTPDQRKRGRKDGGEGEEQSRDARTEGLSDQMGDRSDGAAEPEANGELPEILLLEILDVDRGIHERSIAYQRANATISQMDHRPSVAGQGEIASRRTTQLAAAL